jgi:urease accessory protein
VQATARTASAEIVFAREPEGRTFIRRQFSAYPYHLCRPHYFVGDPPGMATLYLQSASGGIFQNDRLCLAIVAEQGARAHVTTQASTIVHSMEAGDAEQTVYIDARPGTLVEYLPDPMILFPASRLTSRFEVRVHQSATLIACDAFLAHDPGGRDRNFAWLDSALVIKSPDDRVLARDAFHLTGDVFTEAIPGIIGAYTIQGTLLVLHRSERLADLVDALRSALEPCVGLYAGVSLLPGGCGACARVLGLDAHAVKSAIRAAWFAARRCISGSEPAVRRK